MKPNAVVQFRSPALRYMNVDLNKQYDVYLENAIYSNGSTYGIQQIHNSHLGWLKKNGGILDKLDSEVRFDILFKREI